METDYLVVGAGASGMAFADALVAESDADVVLVDRRHRPGGHWNDDYPFVRLHQPSAYYGVNSRPLGHDRIDEHGPNAGFYERATAAELCDYYGRVLDDLLATGRVRFLGMCDYRGQERGGHVVATRLTGETSTVNVRRKLVDATYMETTLPSTHTPAFSVGAGARLVTPNDLAKLGAPASGYTVFGAGKTSMDTCCWLMEQGVAPERIRWVRPRDPYVVDRSLMQPLKLIAGIAEWLARQTGAAAQAEDAADFVGRLEDAGAITRLDPATEPSVFRGAILSAGERDALGQIDNVVRLGRVTHLGSDRIDLAHGAIPTDGGQVHVDCTAPGLGLAPLRTIFEPGRITVQRIQAGIDPFSAALIGVVEATRDDDREKNRLCPPNPITGELRETANAFLANLKSRAAWTVEPDLNEWLNSTRLSPFRDAGTHLADNPAGQAAMVRMVQGTGAGIENLERILANSTSARAAEQAAAASG